MELIETPLDESGNYIAFTRKYDPGNPETGEDGDTVPMFAGGLNGSNCDDAHLVLSSLGDYLRTIRIPEGAFNIAPINFMRKWGLQGLGLETEYASKGSGRPWARIYAKYDHSEVPEVYIDTAHPTILKRPRFFVPKRHRHQVPPSKKDLTDKLGYRLKDGDDICFPLFSLNIGVMV